MYLAFRIVESKRCVSLDALYSNNNDGLVGLMHAQLKIQSAFRTYVIDRIIHLQTSPAYAVLNSHYKKLFYKYVLFADQKLCNTFFYNASCLPHCQSFLSDHIHQCILFHIPCYFQIIVAIIKPITAPTASINIILLLLVSHSGSSYLISLNMF